jgi:hypothetical protein
VAEEETLKTRKILPIEQRNRQWNRIIIIEDRGTVNEPEDDHS